MLPNTALTVAGEVAIEYDANGYPLPGRRAAPPDPLPGRTLERPDHSWVLALDPGLWPVREGDHVIEPVTGREWLVVSANLLHNSLDPVVDYVRVEAEARQAGGTLPPGVNPEGPT
jgi:hypothetical protein